MTPSSSPTPASHGSMEPQSVLGLPTSQEGPRRGELSAPPPHGWHPGSTHLVHLLRGHAGPTFSLMLIVSGPHLGKPGECPASRSLPFLPQSFCPAGQAVRASQHQPIVSKHPHPLPSGALEAAAWLHGVSLVPNTPVYRAASLLFISKHLFQNSKKTFLSQQSLNLVDKNVLAFTLLLQAYTYRSLLVYLRPQKSRKMTFSSLGQSLRHTNSNDRELVIKKQTNKKHASGTSRCISNTSHFHIPTWPPGAFEALDTCPFLPSAPINAPLPAPMSPPAGGGDG